MSFNLGSSVVNHGGMVHNIMFAAPHWIQREKDLLSGVGGETCGRY